MDIDRSDFVAREGWLHELLEGYCKGDCVLELVEPNKGFLIGWFGMALSDVIEDYISHTDAIFVCVFLRGGVK